MQDVIELSLGTARRAHAAILQEMEKGKLSWEDSDQVEKCKNCHTQCMLTSVKPAHSTVNQACIFITRVNVNNSNANSTFIALNLYLLTDSKTHKTKNQRL